MINQLPTISNRLRAAAELVSPGYRLADVGTDHGFLPIYLCMSGKIPSAIAMDLREGPLSRARSHVDAYGMQDRIELRLSDGIENLAAYETEALSVMGMGGMLISRILKRDPSVTGSMKELILGAQSEPEVLRETLEELHFIIDNEVMIEEEGKYYPLIHAVPASYLCKADESHDNAWKERTAPETERRTLLKYGPKLLEKKDPVLFRYMQEQKNVYLRIEQKLAGQNSVEAGRRHLEIKEELRLLEAAFRYYEM